MSVSRLYLGQIIANTREQIVEGNWYSGLVGEYVIVRHRFDNNYEIARLTPTQRQHGLVAVSNGIDKEDIRIIEEYKELERAKVFVMQNGTRVYEQDFDKMSAFFNSMEKY